MAKAGSQAPRARKPSREERALWRAAMKDARTLRRRPPGAGEAGAEREEAPEAAAPPSAKRAATSGPPVPAPPLRDLALGEAAGLDKRSWLRLKRGQYPIEAKLDLHGLTQAQAHGTLARFLKASVERGRRCVLIVTGKGLGSRDAPAGGEGVLRRAVPRWLNGPELRPLVVALAEARPEHGGAGALYVLLKRRRAGPAAPRGRG